MLTWNIASGTVYINISFNACLMCVKYLVHADIGLYAIVLGNYGYCAHYSIHVGYSHHHIGWEVEVAVSFKNVRNKKFFFQLDQLLDRL